MEAGKCGQVFAQLATETQSLDAVRALHQTVVALRVALDKSRTELQALRVKVQSHIDTAIYADTIEKLALENHILRQRVIDEGKVPDYVDQFLKCSSPKQKIETVDTVGNHMETTNSDSVQEVPKPVGQTKDSPKEVETKESPKNDPKRESLINRDQSKISPKQADQTKENQTQGQNIGNAKYTDSVQECQKQVSEEVLGHTGILSRTLGNHALQEKSEVSDKCDKKQPSGRSLSEEGDRSAGSETSQQDGEILQDRKTMGESDNESEELDDIELIFTTEETKELGVLQEDLVSITDSEVWQPSGNLHKFPEMDQFDEAPEDSSGADGGDKNHIDSTEKVSSNLTRTWTQSVLVETDISKCGVLDDAEIIGNISRRNTLPNPLMYQPIIHREALSGSRSQLLGPTPNSPRPMAVKFAPSPSSSPRGTKPDFRKSPVRPILMERNSTKRESEAQTDITALPSHWKSESYLAHKVAHPFTTLPSKFAMPVPQTSQNKYSLKLADKTQEARRTLLSDINFTSMVPELSRSADHLCQEDLEDCSRSHLGSGLCRNYPRAHTYMKGTSHGSSVVSPSYGHQREYSKESWSPCDCAQSSNLINYSGSHGRSSWDCYQGSMRYRGSLTSIPSQHMYEYSDSKRRHSWRPSPEMYRSSSMALKPSWGSVPSSPTHSHRSRNIPFSPSYATPRSDMNLFSTGYWSGGRDSQYSISSRNIKVQPTTRIRSRNKVTFQESSFQRRSHPGQSLPDLRVDMEPDSGDSTDSLIDEAEEYLRRSIDSILTGTDWSKVGRRRQTRRMSEPDPIREISPPQTSQPFLPKVPRDIKLDYFVKVITNEGRVMVGRTRYVGSVPNRPEPHVGVELAKDAGDSDGTFEGRRFFDCEPGRAVFVPFKKVVMAWTV
ncbi:uncharacterized protein [Anabrus simplex]|uniref:uncharacterized protein n=1 Tax=Anabrus simplex TaxID=316456 RepID=UPI0034DCF7BA